MNEINVNKCKEEENVEDETHEERQTEVELVMTAFWLTDAEGFGHAGCVSHNAIKQSDLKSINTSQKNRVLIIL